MHTGALVCPEREKRAFFSLATRFGSVFLSIFHISWLFVSHCQSFHTVLWSSNLGSDFHSIPIRVRT